MRCRTSPVLHRWVGCRLAGSHSRKHRNRGWQFPVSSEMRNALAVRSSLPNRARTVGSSPWARCVRARKTSHGRRMAGCLLGTLSSDLGPGSDALAEDTSWHGPSAKCREIGKARNHPQLVKLTSCRGISGKVGNAVLAPKSIGMPDPRVPHLLAVALTSPPGTRSAHSLSTSSPVLPRPEPSAVRRGYREKCGRPFKILTRYARRARLGNHQRQCCRVGDFFDAMLKPFRERDSPHGICMLSGSRLCDRRRGLPGCPGLFASDAPKAGQRRAIELLIAQYLASVAGNEVEHLVP